MPKLVKIETNRIYLPSTVNESSEADRAWVEMKKESVGADAMKASTGIDDVDRTIRMLSSMITEWNFTDDNGEVEPINTDTLSRLNLEDFSDLVIRMKEIVNASAQSTLPQDGEKKTTSIDISMPSTPETPAVAIPSPR